MKKIFLIVAMIFVTIMANAHVFLFQLKHEKFGNTNLIIDTDKQTINWKDGLFDIMTIKYSNICIDNPYVNNSSVSGYEKAANMQYFFYSSNLPKPKSIKASLEDIVEGKYGEGCIITIKGVILFFKDKNEGNRTASLYGFPPALDGSRPDLILQIQHHYVELHICRSHGILLFSILFPQVLIPCGDLWDNGSSVCGLPPCPSPGNIRPL